MNKVENFNLTQDHGCIPRGNSLFLFKHDMPCRAVFFNIIHHPAFDQFILVIILAGSVLLAWETPMWDPQSAQSIAVLPFQDMSPSGESAYLGDGLSEELSSDLAKLPGLRVAARTAAAGCRSFLIQFSR